MTVERPPLRGYLKILMRQSGATCGMLGAGGNASIAARIAVIGYAGLNEKIVYAHRDAMSQLRWSPLLRHPYELFPDGLGMFLTLFVNARVLLESVTLLFQRHVLLTRHCLVIFATIHVRPLLLSGPSAP